MSKRMNLAFWLAVLTASLEIAAASPPVIGLARSRTAMIVNHASVPGVATILEGTSVETIGTPSNLNLTSGERLVLAPGSSATVHQDRLLLDRGSAELTGSPRYRIETADFRIGASTVASRIQVEVQSAGRVHVEAFGGTAEVHNAQGLLVAKVLPSSALQLQATNSSSTQLAGTVQSRNGKFYLTDKVSNVGVELRGANLASLLGKRVGIVGTRIPGGVAEANASQVIAVSRAIVDADDSGGGSADSSSPDSAPDPSPPPSPPAPGGKKKKALMIIVGGAAVAGGTVGGLFAAGVIGGSSSVSQ